VSLNIKNEETHRLARELASATGESMTDAVSEAIRERLERVRSKNSREGLAEHLLRIGRDCAAHMKEPYKSMDIDELLYDEKGMPK
jgi:antitoxin VapB